MMKISDFIIHLISIIITQTIFIYNYGSMSSQKLEINKRTLLVIIISSLVVFVNNYFNLVILRFSTGIILTCLVNSLIYKDKLKIVCFYSIAQSIIYIILELIFSPILMFKFDNINLFNNEVFYKSFFSIIVGIISIFIFKNRKIYRFVEKVKIIFFEKLNIYFISISTIIVLNFMIGVRALKTSDIYLVISTLIGISFMLLTLRIIVNDKYNITILNERNKNLKEHFKAYSKTIDDCRELKHNLKNDLYTIKTFLSKEVQDKINIIINKYNKDYEWINMIDDIPEGIQGIIYLKQKEAKQKKIQLNINNKNNLSTNDIDYVDLSSILGILIDNAIDATYKLKNKIIEININENKNILDIIIMNKFKNDVDINRIGKKNYSTKEYKSGIGLNFIKKVNNPKIKVNFKVVNDMFITNVKYIKKK